MVAMTLPTTTATAAHTPTSATTASDTLEETIELSAGGGIQSANTTEARMFSQEEVNRLIKRETEKAVKKAQTTAEQVRADADKSESEKLQSEITRLRVELRTREAQDAFEQMVANEKLKPLNARAVFKLIKDDIEFDRDNQPTNIDTLLIEAKATYPELFGHSTINAGERGSNETGKVLPGLNRLQYAYSIDPKSNTR